MYLQEETRYHVAWLAVQELNLSYYVGETLLCTTYVYTYISIYIYGNLIEAPEQQPSCMTIRPMFLLVISGPRLLATRSAVILCCCFSGMLDASLYLNPSS